LVVVVLASVGCSDTTNTEPAPDEGVTALGPGTPIAEGFTVPDGAELRMWPTPVERFDSSAPPPEPGSPTPGEDDFGDTTDTGWFADLRVSDPVLAFNELAAQAAREGFAMISMREGDCQTWTGTTSCSADGYRERDGAVEHVRLWSQVSNNAEGSNASITVTPVPDGAVLPEFGDGPWQAKHFEPSTVDAVDIDVDMSPPDVEPGDRLSSSRYNPTTLAEGSKLVYPIGGRGFCRVTIEVTGDPDEVFAAYVDHIDEWAEEHGGPSILRPEQQLFGRRTVAARAKVDGEVYSAEMVVGRDGEPTRILLVQDCE
jgi:hypothetical protein